MRNNLNNYANVVHAIDPASTSGATTTSAAIDTNGYDELLLIGQAGAIGGTSIKWHIEDCATSGGSYAAITGAATDAETVATATYMGRLDLDGAERYIKVVQTTVGAALGGACVVLSCKKELPSGMTTQFDVTDGSA